MKKAEMLMKRANGQHNDDLMLAMDLFRLIGVLASIVKVTIESAQPKGESNAEKRTD